jgi:hypothetical protein
MLRVWYHHQARATLRPRADHHYELKVSYRDEIYNVVIQEAAAARGQVRDIELRRLDACVPG